MAEENVDTNAIEDQEQEAPQVEDNTTAAAEEEAAAVEAAVDRDDDAETIEDFPPLPEGYEEAFAPEDEDEVSNEPAADAVGACQRISEDEWNTERRAYTQRMLEASGLFQKHTQSVRRVMASQKKIIFQASLFAILAITFLSLIILSPWKIHMQSDDERSSEAPIVGNAELHGQEHQDNLIDEKRQAVDPAAETQGADELNKGSGDHQEAADQTDEAPILVAETIPDAAAVDPNAHADQHAAGAPAVAAAAE